MKVTGLRITTYEHLMSRRMGDSNSPSGRDMASTCIVEIATDEDLVGVAIGG